MICPHCSHKLQPADSSNKQYNCLHCKFSPRIEFHNGEPLISTFWAIEMLEGDFIAYYFFKQNLLKLYDVSGDRPTELILSLHTIVPTVDDIARLIRKVMNLSVFL